MMKKFSFKKLFGSRKDPVPGGNLKVSTAENASQRSTLERLREMEDLLQKKQSHLEQRIAEQFTVVKKFGKTNKRAALMALRRKRRLEEELKRVDGTYTTIEMQREALEAARNNVQVLGALRDAAGVLKAAQKHVSVDKVLDIMEEVNEQQGLAKEVAEAMANPLYGMDAGLLDEAELDRELELLEQEELDKALLEVNGVTVGIKAPQAGSDSGGEETTGYAALSRIDSQSKKGPPKSIDPDEKELEELAQWAL